jgi:hypothetical protein
MLNTRSNKIGLAGEFRVMSELLLRGHNPAKSYLDDGPDLILENGVRIEIKSSHRSNGHGYLFTLKGGARRKRQNLDDCDFLVCWAIDDDCFFIIPKEQVPAASLGIYRCDHGKYVIYKEKWDLLVRGK